MSAVNWDAEDWGGRVHVVITDDLGKGGRHSERMEDDE